MTKTRKRHCSITVEGLCVLSVAALLLWAGPRPVQAARIGDIVDVNGIRSNPLMGT
ncbi:MAG: hypothetical protein GX298_04560, partial [Planctomycetes bacterium]|nr:hypothetical protein [Planctomycetota bacterium]